MRNARYLLDDQAIKRFFTSLLPKVGAPSPILIVSSS